MANVGGRAALIDGEHYFDVAAVSGGALSSDPMKALSYPAGLAKLGSALAELTPTGNLADSIFMRMRFVCRESIRPASRIQFLI